MYRFKYDLVVSESVSKLSRLVSSPCSDLIFVKDVELQAASNLSSELRWWHPAGIARTCVSVPEPIDESDGVPARDALADDGLVGETDPVLLERCDEAMWPSLVDDAEEALDDGMMGGCCW